MKAISDVAADFDRIAAALAQSPDSPLTAAERAVLRAVPAEARSCLEVGCGDGRLARALGTAGLAVFAIDVAPQMIALARARTPRELRIEYAVADVMTAELPVETADLVLGVNVVHHLPLPTIVPRLAGLVAPGGTLIIQDVVTRDGLRHLPRNIVAAIRNRLGRLRRARPAVSRVQQLYDEHGREEVYLRPKNAAATLSAFLPGVAVTHHLDWRYTAVWHREAAT
jgi:2-polyprenyl-3-methyl-5-hydroxy-6-metoxy-1,4-benzoquinol methylase